MDDGAPIDSDSPVDAGKNARAFDVFGYPFPARKPG